MLRSMEGLASGVVLRLLQAENGESPDERCCARPWLWASENIPANAYDLWARLRESVEEYATPWTGGGIVMKPVWKDEHA